MKKHFFTFLFAVAAFCTINATSTQNFYADDAAIDQLIASTQEMQMNSFLEISSAVSMTNSENFSVSEDKEAIVAWLLCWVVGEFGVHRHYLGTKGSMWAIYTFTCFGIFGIVPFVDWWVLLINGVIKEDISKYVGNEKFFMWA